MTQHGDRDTKSDPGIEGRLRLLAKWAKSPSKAPDFVKVACVNQAALAALHRPDLGIRPISLNTLKAHAARKQWYGSDGWTAMEALRCAIRGRAGSGGQPPAPRPGSKDALSQQVTELKRLLDKVHRSRALLIRAYMDLLSLTQQASRNDAELVRKVKRHQVSFVELGIRPVAS